MNHHLGSGCDSRFGHHIFKPGHTSAQALALVTALSDKGQAVLTQGKEHQLHAFWQQLQRQWAQQGLQAATYC